uniref:Uncharacterized protein n=1 Tax=Rhizophora mucronata TaxID=61149 RepID=A0A2P2Q416_RHIMU
MVKNFSRLHILIFSLIYLLFVALYSCWGHFNTTSLITAIKY